MKITKKLEKEILAVMDDYWGSYLRGDLQTWASYLPDHYLNIGATKEEIWGSKKEIVDYTEMVIDQMVGMVEVRNKKTQIFPIAPYFMVHELGDLFIKVEEAWTFYAPARISSVLEKTKDGWKILHQHGSYPDSKTEEGEAFAFDELRAENKKLRDAIQARTIELERKNRELEIEAAMERVRSRSLAMYKTDELQEVVRVLAEELKNTGVILDTWGAVICTYFQDSKDVLHWTAAEDPANPSVAFLLPYFKDELYDDAWASKNRGDSYFAKVFSFEVKNAFFKHAFEHSDYRQLPDDYKQMILQSDSHGIAWAWAKNSAIMIPSILGKLPSEEEKEILIRFAKVFEQAYVRFMDLQTKEEQAAKIAQEKQRLEKTLRDLQLTQKQLIHAEKMASLGELTAGIAHEIQNPLNFVNNFSELNIELINELKNELNLVKTQYIASLLASQLASQQIDRSHLDEVEDLMKDIESNQQKINHHGKRADAIVKGMLQHSRQSTAEKTATDINKLADEYLRLAYHGLRAKDKSFNATLHTDFDPALEPLMVIPQEMGRVLLNLITNAFYAVHEKKMSNGTDYQPTVTMSTKQMEDHVLIAVKDNGNGIPQRVLDKIFQPFFTTKPTGQGTGLGLSLSYDIVKAHEGKLEVETEEGAQTIFKIILPKQVAP
jgi:signal transduction histidine kinase